MKGRYLKVIILSDGETVHNAFSIAHSSHEDKILSRTPILYILSFAL